MRARFLILASALLAMLSTAPAEATQRCSNVLADGRVIVQGPLVTTLGAFCSVAVVPGTAGLTLIERAHFAGNFIILSPPFAVAPQRFVIFEQPFAGAGAVLLPSPAFAVRGIVPFATVPGFAAVPSMRFTTGTIGPLTTFSNSPRLGGVVVVAPAGTIIATRPGGMAAGRR